MDFTYFFPWKYAGVRFQGAGVDLTTSTVSITSSNGSSRSGSGSAAAGVITGDFILRLPLDDFWPSVHLAPYIFGGGMPFLTLVFVLIGHWRPLYSRLQLLRSHMQATTRPVE